MPAHILHADAVVTCAHAGRAQPCATDPKVSVDGHAVAVLRGPYTVSGCTQPPPTSGNGPCATAQFTTSALKVGAGGLPVLLSDSKATCVPTGTPLQIRSTQMKVSAS
ncbi:hypothetical protein ACFRIB_01525 [Streptomyces mirabilis]|uniref:hypothetical protein n=1 Tax=Streptomyces mirabilis TaxID=68239 RepID=UPI003675AF8E